jgi:hypothetical protein
MSSISQNKSTVETTPQLQQADEKGVNKKPVQAKRERLSSLDVNVRFPQKLLNFGFCFALFLSVSCLALSAYYLHSFLVNTNSGLENLISGAGSQLKSDTLEVAIAGRVVMARLSLISCGVFVGVSFGFLGFALFLIGVRGEMDASAEYEHFKTKLARLSPGVFIILCATILIVVCITREIEFGYDITRRSPSQPNDASKGTSPSRPEPPITDDNKP